MKTETTRSRYTVPVTFHVTPEQKQALALVSIERDLSVSHLVRRAVVKKLIGKAKSNGS